MEKMDGGSFDEVAANIAAIGNLFPQAVSEGKVDFETLKGCLGAAVEERKDFYRLLWNGKEESRAFSRVRSQATLRPCPEESKDWATTQNLYIEGDNLEVLKLLQGAYHNSVKMIYIDPPYNTGKDFVYRDNFHDSVENYKQQTGQVDAEGNRTSTNSETSGRYHTNWLNMIFPRLLVARNLLRDDGLIFISIDDNEVSNLRKVCDEVFGEDNMLNGKCFISHIPNGTNKGLIARAHEYVLAYAKDATKVKSFNRVGNNGDDVSVERCTNTPTEKNPLSEIKFKKGMRFEGENARFVGKIGDKEPIYIEGEMVFENGKLKDDVVLKSSWRNRAQVMEVIECGSSLDEQGQEVFDVFFTKEGKPKYKKRLTCFSPKSVQVFKRYDFESTFDALSFENPKPVSLVEFFVKLCCAKNDLVLDFFSGSATTANAVMRINEELGWGLRTILIQLPENLDISLSSSDGKAQTFIERMIRYLDQKLRPHFLTEIGKERWRLSGDMVMDEWRAKNDAVDSELKLDDAAKVASVKPDIGFRVFKLDTSNITAWNAKAADIEQELLNAEDNILAGRTREDLLYEILLKSNVMLTARVKEVSVDGRTIYVADGGKLMACLDDRITVDVADEMVRLWKGADARTGGTSVPPVIVFRETGFASDEDKANALTMLKSAGIETVRTI